MRVETTWPKGFSMVSSSCSSIDSGKLEMYRFVGSCSCCCLGGERMNWNVYAFCTSDTNTVKHRNISKVTNTWVHTAIKHLEPHISSSRYPVLSLALTHTSLQVPFWSVNDYTPGLLLGVIYPSLAFSLSLSFFAVVSILFIISYMTNKNLTMDTGLHDYNHSSQSFIQIRLNVLHFLIL